MHKLNDGTENQPKYFRNQRKFTICIWSLISGSFLFLCFAIYGISLSIISSVKQNTNLIDLSALESLSQYEKAIVLANINLSLGLMCFTFSIVCAIEFATLIIIKHKNADELFIFVNRWWLHRASLLVVLVGLPILIVCLL